LRQRGVRGAPAPPPDDEVPAVLRALGMLAGGHGGRSAQSSVVEVPPGGWPPVAFAVTKRVRRATGPPATPQNWAEAPVTWSSPRSGSSLPPGKYSVAWSFHSWSTSARSSTNRARPATDSHEPASAIARFTWGSWRSASAWPPWRLTKNQMSASSPTLWMAIGCASSVPSGSAVVSMTVLASRSVSTTSCWLRVSGSFVIVPPCSSDREESDATSRTAPVPGCRPVGLPASSHAVPLPTLYDTHYGVMHERFLRHPSAGAAARHRRARVPASAAHPRVRLRPARGPRPARLRHGCEHALPAPAPPREAGAAHQHLEHRRGTTAEVLPHLHPRRAARRHPHHRVARAHRRHRLPHRRDPQGRGVLT